jgi:alcohol dehydrogenase (cytochrome c)
MFYLTDTDPRPEGWGGIDSVVGSDGGALLAIDYKSGKTVWRHDWPSGSGVVAMLSTAGKLLFTSNGNNLIAFEPSKGNILWHAGLTASPSAGPITYMLDGKQYLLVAAGDTIFTFTVHERQ